MTQSKLKRALQTRIVHAEDKLTPGFESFSMPVTRASTVVFPDLATMRALDWKTTRNGATVCTQRQRRSL